MYPFSKDPVFSDTIRGSQMRPIPGGCFTNSYETDLFNLFGDQPADDGHAFTDFDDHLFGNPCIKIENPKQPSLLLSDDPIPLNADDDNIFSFLNTSQDTGLIMHASQPMFDDYPLGGLATRLSDDGANSGAFDDGSASFEPWPAADLSSPVAQCPPPAVHHKPASASVKTQASSRPIVASSPPSSADDGMLKRHQRPSGATTSTKMASRIFALQHMFAASLPIRKPDFLSEAQWRELSSSLLTVEVVECQSDRVSVRMATTFDIIVHSLANYGQSLKEWTESPATRFRWWSDFNIANIKVGNRNVNKAGTVIERTVILPPKMISHPYIQAAWKRRDNHALLKEFSSFFSRLLKNYLHPDDHQAFEDGGFGRTRKRPRCNDSATSALELTLDATLAALDRQAKGG